MFINVTVKTVEDFIDDYFPFYAQNWNNLTEEEKLFLISFFDKKNSYDCCYHSSKLMEASYDATGLYDFAVCRDLRNPEGYMNDSKDGVKFADVKKRFDMNYAEKELLELMEKNPKAMTLFYIFASFFSRVSEIKKDELFSILESDRESAEKIKKDLGKGLRLDDYISFIYEYFEEHPLKNIVFQFRKINGNHNILEISCFHNRIEFTRPEMKNLIPLLEYVDNHFLELCTWSFMNDAETTARSWKKSEDEKFASSWEHSLKIL